MDPSIIKQWLIDNPQYNPYPVPGRKKGGKNKEKEVLPLTPELIEQITLTPGQVKEIKRTTRKKPVLSEEEIERRKQVLAQGREVLRQKKELEKQEREKKTLQETIKEKGMIPVKVKARKQRVKKDPQEVLVAEPKVEDSEDEESYTTDEETVSFKKKLDRKKRILDEIDQTIHQVKQSSNNPIVSRYQRALMMRGF